MKKRFVLAAAVVLLAGCTDADWSRLTRFDAAPSYPAPATASAPSPVVATAPSVSARTAENCARSARARSSDAQAQGFDDDTRRSVYDTTYADCLKWAARSGMQ